MTIKGKARCARHLAILSKTAAEDTAMMLVTGLTSRTPLLRCDEGALRFRPVTDNYPICDNDWPMGGIAFGRAIRFFSLWKKNGSEKNTLKYSYLQITV